MILLKQIICILKSWKPYWQIYRSNAFSICLSKISKIMNPTKKVRKYLNAYTLEWWLNLSKVYQRLQPTEIFSKKWSGNATRYQYSKEKTLFFQLNEHWEYVYLHILIMMLKIILLLLLKDFTNYWLHLSLLKNLKQKTFWTNFWRYCLIFKNKLSMSNTCCFQIKYSSQ